MQPKKEAADVFEGLQVLADWIPSETVSKFLAKISIGNDACWNWTGAKRNSQGYGVFSISKFELFVAHRFSFLLFTGKQPQKGRHLHHLCENPGCVNPHHLAEVTPWEHTVLYTPGSIPARLARATHCENGHAYEGNDVRVDPITGKRHCRACAREWAKRTRTEQIAALGPELERTTCNAGLHPWITENQFTNSTTGMKGCLLCRREYQRVYQREYKKAGEKRGPQHKTHCKQGHEFTAENTQTNKRNGHRDCRICMRAAGAKYRAKLNAATP